MPAIPRGTEIIGSAAADLENSRLPLEPLFFFFGHAPGRDQRADVHRGLIVVAKRRDLPVLDVNLRYDAAKRRRNNKIMNVFPIVAALKMRVVVVGKKKGVGKLRPQ